VSLQSVAVVLERCPRVVVLPLLERQLVARGQVEVPGWWRAGQPLDEEAWLRVGPGALLPAVSDASLVTWVGVSWVACLLCAVTVFYVQATYWCRLLCSSPSRERRWGGVDADLCCCCAAVRVQEVGTAAQPNYTGPSLAEKFKQAYVEQDERLLQVALKTEAYQMRRALESSGGRRVLETWLDEL
jgi:hypothetical protein